MLSKKFLIMSNNPKTTDSHCLETADTNGLPEVDYPAPPQGICCIGITGVSAAEKATFAPNSKRLDIRCSTAMMKPKKLSALTPSYVSNSLTLWGLHFTTMRTFGKIGIGGLPLSGAKSCPAHRQGGTSAGGAGLCQPGAGACC